jgi:hypothetical protein
VVGGIEAVEGSIMVAPFGLLLRLSEVFDRLLINLDDEMIGIILNSLSLSEDAMQLLLKPLLNDVAKLFVAHLELLELPDHFEIFRLVLVEIIFLPLSHHALPKRHHTLPKVQDIIGDSFYLFVIGLLPALVVGNLKGAHLLRVVGIDGAISSHRYQRFLLDFLQLLILQLEHEFTLGLKDFGDG